MKEFQILFDDEREESGPQSDEVLQTTILGESSELVEKLLHGIEP